MSEDISYIEMWEKELLERRSTRRWACLIDSGRLALDCVAQACLTHISLFGSTCSWLMLARACMQSSNLIIWDKMYSICIDLTHDNLGLLFMPPRYYPLRLLYLPFVLYTFLSLGSTPFFQSFMHLSYNQCYCVTCISGWGGSGGCVLPR